VFETLKQLLLILYGLPTIVAHERGHLHADRIAALNVYTGRTGTGWLAVVVAFECDLKAAYVGRTRVNLCKPRQTSYRPSG